MNDLVTDLLKSLSNLSAPYFIGAHYSSEPSILNSIARAKRDGVSTYQIMLGPVQSWFPSKFDKDTIHEFRTHVDGLRIFAHAPFYINLCSAKEQHRILSYKGVIAHLYLAEKLGIEGVNIHIGSAGKEATTEEARAKVDDSILKIFESYSGSVKLIFENAAGDGTRIGSNIVELAKLSRGVNKYLGRDATGICIDTAHAFAAGYDVTTEEFVREVYYEVNDVLSLVHLNDVEPTVCKLGNKKDRHAGIGREGGLGLSNILRLIQVFKYVPMILERRSDEGIDNDYNVLRQFVSGADATNIDLGTPEDNTPAPRKKANRPFKVIN